ncbi:hypothetical protein BC833DRAFT_612369 [Globomyces pollinis-pini]|nr:hypothetical protein BC833DRAFT_612369 [Globomyces pollinis-pini]
MASTKKQAEFQDFSQKELTYTVPLKTPRSNISSSQSIRSSEPETSVVRPILEYQELAPSPSQTFYQIAVYPWQPSRPRTRSQKSNQDSNVQLNRDIQKSGCVMLRDWPRKRHSQQWRRDGMINPGLSCRFVMLGEMIIKFEDFVDGEQKLHLITVFGQDRYQCLIDAVRGELEKKEKYSF